MKGKGKLIGFFVGILAAVVIALCQIPGLSYEGRLCLAFTLMAVIWWSTQVTQSGFVSGVFLMLLCLFKVAELTDIFYGWTTSTIWMIIGAYLIAAAVQNSGLGKRLSYAIISRFVRNWTSIIVTVFVLTFLLSILIPSPFPRAFIIMSVMSVLIKTANIKKEDAAKIGFSVFACAVPVSAIFLTGDAGLNAVAASYVSGSVNFVQWFQVVGVPAIVLSFLNLVLILVLFKPSADVSPDMLDTRFIAREREKLGKITGKEIKALVLIAIAVFFWMTNGITGINVGWTTLGIAMVMSLPVVGGLIGPKDWTSVPVNVLFFVTAAMAIGQVGKVTGMTQWLADTLIPEVLPQNIILLVLLVFVICLALHMLMGSVMSVFGVALPMFVVLADKMGLPEIIVMAVVYFAVGGHYMFPFHNLDIVVGVGEENAGYTQKHCLKMGTALIPAVALTLIFAIGWWKIIGVL